MVVFILNLIILLINIFLFILIASKLGKIETLKEECLNIKNDFDGMLYEQTYLSTQYLKDIEEKISEAKKLFDDLTERQNNIIEKENNQVKDNIERYNPITVEIAKMLQEGKSVTEIAEKLNSTKGEVILRLNLGEKIIKKSE